MAWDAQRYDAWFDSAWGGYAFAVELRTVQETARVRLGEKVLEVGAGTGRFGAALADSGATVYGLDIDADMLSLARGRLERRGVLADVHNLPFRANTFDLALAVTVCEFTEDVPQVIAELARVTRGGGRLVVGSLNPRSAWGIMSRGRRRAEPWRSARFLSRRQLLALGRRHGQSSLRGALFSVEGLGAGKLAVLLEQAGRLAPALGAFQVLRVEIPDPAS